MGKERNPFLCLGDISRRAADQLMFPVRMSDKFGCAEFLDNPAVAAVSDDVIQFHAPNLRAEVGHPLSIPKIIRRHARPLPRWISLSERAFFRGSARVLSVKL